MNKVLFGILFLVPIVCFTVSVLAAAMFWEEPGSNDLAPLIGWFTALPFIVFCAYKAIHHMRKKGDPITIFMWVFFLPLLGPAFGFGYCLVALKPISYM